MMNLIQTLRRLGQQTKFFGFDFDTQVSQYKIIKKLYARYGLEIDGGGACPEQCEVFLNGETVAYYRLRHGEFRVDFPDCGGETIYEAEPNGDGMFNNNERMLYLTVALRHLLKRLPTTTT